MKEDHYKTLTRRTVTKVSDGAGQFTETTEDTDFQGFIGMLSGSEIKKNQIIGNTGTARLLTGETLSKTDRIVDASGYFSEEGTVFEVVWVYKNPYEGQYYDLKII